ncbi:MAG: proteasome-type protease [Gloeomargarita sp. SKYB31]|nr:proteasome-type protease [Gloeomargarita sp. SKYB31]
MTYCLGILTRYGLVMAADSRTHAGVDYISTYRKLFDFSLPGQRVLFLCTSGNLAITQAVVAQLRQDIHQQQPENLHTIGCMYEITTYIGRKIRKLQDENRPWLERDHIDFQCNFLVGGQIHGDEPQLFLIYPQGNCIHATPETPFLQIGETKYGKPILDRTLTYETPLAAAAKCALLSIDSTMKSNISVGPPIHLIAYERDSFQVHYRLELGLGDPYLLEMRRSWECSLKEAFANVPDPQWHTSPTHPTHTNDLVT